jgi:SOS-response transcriptional repressor LexA
MLRANGIAPARTLTARQRQILRYVLDYTMEHGFQPSFYEIADHFDLSSRSGVDHHMALIAGKGYITKGVEGKGNSRSIRILLDPDGVPFRGFTRK